LRKVSLVLRLAEVMPEEVAVLPIPTSAWTPLGCWQKQPLHHNGQKGEDNCKKHETAHTGCGSTTTHLQQDGWSLTVLTLEMQVPGL